MNDIQKEITALRSFIVGDIYIGIAEVFQLVGDTKPDLTITNPVDYIQEIQYDTTFLKKTMIPTLRKIASLYNAEVAVNIVNSLLMSGLTEGVKNYKQITNNELCNPVFMFGNTTLVPNFMEIYYNLMLIGQSDYIEKCFISIARYGMEAVKDLKAAQVFGAIAYTDPKKVALN